MLKIIASIIVVAAVAYGGTCTGITIPRTDSGNTWPSGTVHVYIYTGSGGAGVTNSVAVGGIQDACSAWNAQSPAFTLSCTTYSGLFSPTGNNLDVLVGTGLGQYRAEVHWYAGDKSHYNTHDGYIEFDSSMLDLPSEYMSEGWGFLMSHELGHTAGLGHCRETTGTCKGNSTMSEDASTLGPTTCDMTAYNSYKGLVGKYKNGSGGGCVTNPPY
jgi:hypothetical protein